jgi:hypothetical protein
MSKAECSLSMSGGTISGLRDTRMLNSIFLSSLSISSIQLSFSTIPLSPSPVWLCERVEGRVQFQHERRDNHFRPQRRKNVEQHLSVFFKRVEQDVECDRFNRPHKRCDVLERRLEKLERASDRLCTFPRIQIFGQKVAVQTKARIR